jgi:hypothetical protein
MRDLDVRRALHETVLAAHRGEPDTLVVDELGLECGDVRVDVAVVNGSIHGYEIKSDADTLERLPAQAEVYSRVLDRVTLVAGKHLDEAAALVPSWWGLARATERPGGGVRVVPRRAAKRNPNVVVGSVVMLLWRDEALAILEAHGRARGLRSKPRRAVYAALAKLLPHDDLCRVVREALRARKGWRVGG